MLGIEEDGDLTGVLQNGVLHRGQVGDALQAQFLQQLVQREPGLGHLPLQNGPMVDDDAGAATEEVAQGDALEGEDGQEHGQGEEGDDGDEAVGQGDAEILHGHGGQVRDEHGEHQLHRLQLSHLLLAHDADAHGEQQV